MKRYRIEVVEETQGRGPARFRARPDLNGTCEADVPSMAKRVTKMGIRNDKRFEGLTIVSIAMRDNGTVRVLVRSAHHEHVRQIPGKVYKAPV